VVYVSDRIVALCETGWGQLAGCEVQALSAGICAGARHWCRVMKKIFTSRVR
jgi:hypothetical protein